MKQSIKNRIIDGLLIALMVLPFVGCMVLKALTAQNVLGEIAVSGSQIYISNIPMPVMNLDITESQVVSLAVVLSLLGLCLYLTRGMTVVPTSKRQHIAEMLVEKCTSFVEDNMGPRFTEGFAPFVAGIMALSALSSLSSLLGLHPPTSDINIVAGWAILVFLLITYYKLKGGVGNYLKSFADPIPVFAPFNVISEIATPVSMTFRHYGNVLSGVVISALIASALQGLSNLILGWLPDWFGTIPLLQIGVPAVLSLYFDLFSGLLQAFIFAMLTMLYISNGFPEEAYEQRQAKRKKNALHNV